MPVCQYRKEELEYNLCRPGGTEHSPGDLDLDGRVAEARC